MYHYGICWLDILVAMREPGARTRRRTEPNTNNTYTAATSSTLRSENGEHNQRRKAKERSPPNPALQTNAQLQNGAHDQEEEAASAHKPNNGTSERRQSPKTDCTLNRRHQQKQIWPPHCEQQSRRIRTANPTDEHKNKSRRGHLRQDLDKEDGGKPAPTQHLLKRVSPLLITWVFISTISVCIYTHHTLQPQMLYSKHYPLRYHPPTHSTSRSPHKRYIPLPNPNNDPILYHPSTFKHFHQWPPP